MTKFKKTKEPSVVTQTLSSKKTTSNTTFGNFKTSFQYLDHSQKYASGFKDWQKHGLLSKALETLQGFCCGRLLEQVDGSKFAIYGDFPKKGDTLYEKPAHVPEDANWARIHVNGPSVIVGHIMGDTFYVVFLDKTHKFWLTKKYKAN